MQGLRSCWPRRCASPSPPLQTTMLHRTRTTPSPSYPTLLYTYNSIRAADTRPATHIPRPPPAHPPPHARTHPPTHLLHQVQRHDCVAVVAQQVDHAKQLAVVLLRTRLGAWGGGGANRVALGASGWHGSSGGWGCLPQPRVHGTFPCPFLQRPHLRTSLSHMRYPTCIHIRVPETPMRCPTHTRART
jgi:hypothetical protein